MVGGEDAVNRKGARHVSEKALLNIEPDQGNIVFKRPSILAETRNFQVEMLCEHQFVSFK